MDLGKPSFRKRKLELPRDFVFDYKSADHLKRFTTDRGKLLPRRMTGLSRINQKQLERSLKRARKLALLPYTIHNFKVDFNALAAQRQASSEMRYSRGGYGGRSHRDYRPAHQHSNVAETESETPKTEIHKEDTKDTTSQDTDTNKSNT